MEEEYGFGLIPSPPDIRDYTLAAGVTKEKLPETFINESVKVKNQGSRSTCVAHSLSSLVEFHNLQETKSYDEFSTEFIYGCRTLEDYLGEGMHLRDGLKVLQKYGDVKYSVLPGNSIMNIARNKVIERFDELTEKAYPYRISTYYKINSLDELKYALYHYGPVPGAMRYYKRGKITSEGIYLYDTNNSYGNHAVLIVGWNKDGFIIQNSWGVLWGKKGYFVVPYKDMDILFYEYYGVTDDINDGNIKQPNAFIKFISPFINWILKLFKPKF